MNPLKELKELTAPPSTSTTPAAPADVSQYEV